MGTYSKQTNGRHSDLEEGELENDCNENLLYQENERPAQNLLEAAPAIHYDSEDDSEEDLSCKKSKKSDSTLTAPASEGNNDEFRNAAHQFQRNKGKANKVWNNVIMDDDIAADLSAIGVKKKSDRHVESYSTLTASRDERQAENHNRKRERQPWKKKRKDPNVRIIKGITNPDDYTDEELAQQIASRLSEKNVEGIEKLVRMVSRQMALEILDQTIEMESLGGMKTQDNGRRRTPGGTYFQLLRCESRIPKKVVRDILYGPTNAAARARKNKNRREKKKREMELAAAAKELRELPSILDVYTKSNENEDFMESDTKESDGSMPCRSQQHDGSMPSDSQKQDGSKPSSSQESNDSSICLNNEEKEDFGGLDAKETNGCMDSDTKENGGSVCLDSKENEGTIFSDNDEFVIDATYQDDL